MTLKRWISTAAAVTALLSTVTYPAYGMGSSDQTGGSATSQTTAASSAGNAIVALGDSITYGYNLGDNKQPSKYAFPFLIGQQEHLQTIDLGQPGWTSEQLDSALQAGTDNKELRQAALVTVYVGGNDLLKPVYNEIKSLSVNELLGSKPITLSAAVQAQLSTNLKQFNATLPQIITDIRAVTQAPIVVYNLYNPVANALSLYTVTDTYVRAANQTVAQVARQQHCVLADAYDAFENHQLQYVLPLDVHPTVQGQAVLAQLAIAALSSAHVTVTSSVYKPPHEGSSGGVILPPVQSGPSAAFVKFIGWLGHSYQLPIVTHGGQVSVSLAALMQAMDHNGFKDSWNGKLWRIDLRIPIVLNIGHVKVKPIGTGTAQIVIAGTPVANFTPIVVKNAATGKLTSYVPVSILTGMFAHVGLKVNFKNGILSFQA